MVWFFGRGNETVQIETRFDNVTREYVLEIAWADRAAETERFLLLPEFQARIAAVEQQLRAQSWAQVGGPEILTDGWRGPFTN